MASSKINANSLVNLPDGFEAPDELVAVAVFEDYAAANDSALAILAMGEAYWMIYAEPVYVMCVDQDRELAVRAELEAIEALQVPKRHLAVDWPLQYFSASSFVFYFIVLVAIFCAQGASDLVVAGRMDSLLVIEESQLWRCVTALMLHADVVHLVSNLVAGGGFVFLVCRLFGSGAGWFSVVLGGILGNWLTAYLYYPQQHLSIGASTAVFAALGILTSSGMWVSVLQGEVKLTLPQWLLPLAAGTALFGLLGVAEGRVDVMGHMNGFMCGGAVGLVLSYFRLKLARLQAALACFTVVLGVTAWLLALLV